MRRDADDTVQLAKTSQLLQVILNKVKKEKSERKGLAVNARKTKCLVMSKNSQGPGRALQLFRQCNERRYKM